MEYVVNGQRIIYHASGNTSRGDETVLLRQAIDLTLKTQWANSGYSIEKLFDSDTYLIFKKGIHTLLIQCWKDAGLDVNENFNPAHYHRKATDLAVHLKGVEKTRLLSVESLPVPVQILEERISEICKTPLVAKNPFDNQSIFHFRVIRPSSGDNNPLHRDVWLEDFDNCINLYIPVAGSNALSSLILIPGSHHWPESRIEKTVGGAFLNGLKFNVPAVTAISGSYQAVRPDPQENEVLIFSPYLIHGGAVNLNTDITRISVEMRLWKK
jgi:hypothetical protein